MTKKNLLYYFCWLEFLSGVDPDPYWMIGSVFRSFLDPDLNSEYGFGYTYTHANIG